jgi:hypothetical protein
VRGALAAERLFSLGLAAVGAGDADKELVFRKRHGFDAFRTCRSINVGSPYAKTRIAELIERAEPWGMRDRNGNDRWRTVTIVTK